MIKKLFGSSEATLESIKSKIKDWSKEVCLPLSGGTLTGSLGVQDVLMVQKQTAQPKINLSDGTHTLNIILDENGDVRFLDNNGRT